MYYLADVTAFDTLDERKLEVVCKGPSPWEKPSYKKLIFSLRVLLLVSLPVLLSNSSIS